MERQSIFRKLTIIIAFIMCLGLFATGFLFPVKSYAATEPTDPTATTYTVAFKIGGQLYTAYKLNSGQTATKPTSGNLASMTWKVSSTGVQYDFSNTISGNLTLELMLSSTQAAVVFLKENPNFTDATSTDEYVKNKYWGLDAKVITKNTTVTEVDSSSVPEKTGYNFSYWTTSESSITAFDFTNPISTTTFLYPKYTLKTYTLTFRHYDDTEETRTVSHGQVLSDVPTPKAQASYIANGWYEESDTSHTLYNFIYNQITSDMVFLALYSAADYQINFSSNSFGTFGTYSSGTFTEFTTQQYSANGANYEFYIQLNSNYNQFALAKTNIARSGTISQLSLDSVSGQTGLFKCILITVASDISINLSNIQKNKYTIEFDNTDAAGITIVPHSSLTLDTDYFIEDGKYKVEYGKYFYFELAVDEKYEAENSVNYDGGQSVYFDAGKVEYNAMRASYRVANTTANSVINITVNTVECVTAVFTGVENLTLSGFDNPNFATALVRWDDSTKTARIRKGTAFTFTATSNDVDRYYILSVTGVTYASSQYRYYSNVNQDVVFTVAETVFVTVPAAMTGSTTITGTSDISGSEVDYNPADSSWTYRVTKGGELKVTFAFTTEYSDTDVTITIPGTTATVNKDEFATNSTVAIQNIDATCTIVIEPLQKNTYTIGLISNDMATLENGEGYASNVVEYAGDFSIRINKRIAYSMAVITEANVNITSNKYESFEVVEVTPEGEEAYYVINIKTIVGNFQVNIEDLQKNTYAVSMIGNGFAELTSSTSTAQYNGSFVCIYTLGSAYSKSTVQPSNVKVIDSATRSEITTYTVEVKTAQKTITITGVITAIEVSIQGLTKNTYTISAEYLGTFEAFNSTKTTRETVEHGSLFTFYLSFENPSYTQSIDVINVQYSINNGDYADLEPVNKDESGSYGILTYTIYNITGNISFNIPALQINRYTVIFYDTDPLDIIYQYNAVVHGNSIQEPTRPTKEGYQCIGWFLTETGSSQFNNFGSGITSDLTLYARYNAQTFTVTFDDDGEDRVITVNYGRQCTPPAVTPRPGFSAYWNVDGLNLSSVKENYTVTAVYTRNNYTVRFLYSSNPAVTGLYDRVLETQTVAYESKATRPTTDPRAQGYTFTSWDYDFVNNAIMRDTDIHAQFTINEYTIKFINVTQGNSVMASYKLNYNTTMTALEPVAVEGIRGKYQFPYYSGGTLLTGDQAITETLSDGFVLEGWYEDSAMSVRYNFDNAIKGDVIIYGNMYISKVSVKFYVDNEFYIEKLVEYNTTLTDIPAVPRKEGYTKTAPQWTIFYPQNGSFENVTNDVKVRADYTINVYTIQFKLPSGDTLVRQVAHGGTVTNIPYPDTDFGEVVVMDDSLIRYVTADTVVYITVIDFLPFLIVAAAACVLTFIVVSLIIAIRNMRRGIKNVKRMEELFSAIKKQDARITQMNEQKLKAEIQEKMKEKEKYKRGSFLDD